MRKWITRFLLRDLWSISLDRCTPPKAFVIRLCRVMVLAIYGLLHDQCGLRASALTLYTFLSIVPLCAMVFGIAQGFGLQQTIEELVRGRLEGQEEVARWIIDFAYSLLKNTSGGWVAGAGVVFLFWSVIRLLQNIETSFNAIWKSQRQRTIARRISDYLSVVLVSPILFIASNSMMVIVAREIEEIGQRVAFVGGFRPLPLIALKLVPYVMIWVLFTFMYLFMPSPKVRFRSGLLAAIIAGTAFSLFQWGYIRFQIGVSQYNAVYGTFAALPLFIIWLQMSWLIVLFGTEICFAHQNADEYDEGIDMPDVSGSAKKVLALGILHHILRKFYAGDRSCSPHDIGQELNVPARQVRQILGELVACGLLFETVDSSEEWSSGTTIGQPAAYQPAQPTERYTLQFVIDTLERCGGRDDLSSRSDVLRVLSERMRRLYDSAHKSEANTHLRDL